MPTNTDTQEVEEEDLKFEGSTGKVSEMQSQKQNASWVLVAHPCNLSNL
jgi:hypothetical protein